MEKEVLLTISGKHIEITEGIRDHVESKISKLPRYYNNINRINVIIDDNSGGKSSVEVKASAEHNRVFIATETGDDMYTCIDQAVRKVERQLLKHKEKERNVKHTHTVVTPPETED